MKAQPNETKSGASTTPEKRRRVIDPTATGQEKAAAIKSTEQAAKPCFRIWTLGQLSKMEEPEGWNLVGDYHITRGAVTVLAGSPGIGKSFASLMLGIQGAIGGGDWLGYSINRPFKTLVIQAENNLLRLIMDAKRVTMPEEHNDRLKVLEFDWGNISLTDAKLMTELRALMADFQPDLVVIDPFNQFSGDSNEKECKEAVRGILSILEAAEVPPACLIVAHNRKKREGDNHAGRRLADLISGSYVMQSNPRCVISYLPYSDDPEDCRVVVLTVKKNNGKHKGPASAWTLCEHGFERIEDFDFADWSSGGDAGPRKDKSKIRLEHLQEVFSGGALTRQEAGRRLEELTGAGRSAVSEAFNKRFVDVLAKLSGGLLWDLKPEHKAESSPFQDDEEDNGEE